MPAMYKKEILKFYGTVTDAARVFNVSPQAVSQWPALVPELIAYKAHYLSNGRLRVRPTLYKNKNARTTRAQ